MKRILLSLGLTCLATLTTHATLIFYEGFNYTNGPIVATSTNGSGTTNWLRHSGSASPSDSIVSNSRLAVVMTSRQDDVNRPFESETNAGPQIVYASFTVNCSNLPSATPTYFAHFNFNNTGFQGRVFQMTGSLPGTWRLGVSAAAGTANKIYPYDLATNVDYQVAVALDPVTAFGATIWVNPIASTDFSLTSQDALTAQTLRAFGFRQASSAGTFFAYITNLAVATTFEEATTNVWSTNAVAPVIVRSPSSITNFGGDTVSLFALAAGQGLGNLTYQWTKDGVGVANDNGNSNVFSRIGAAASDSGDYRLIATTPFGLSATSSPAFLWVTNAPIPPTVIPSTNRTVNVFFHQGTSLHVDASGPPPITYAWYYNNGPTGPNTSGDGTDTLSILDVDAANGTAGAYYCVASNPYGNTTSGVFNVTAVAPPAVSVAFLRTLVDGNYVSTNLANTGPRWQVTGTVTTFTNLTTGNTASYYLQDGTAGINIFVTGGQTFRPAQGDVLTFIGLLSSFNSTLELLADANDLSTSYTVLSNNFAGLPAARVIPFNITNNLALCESELEGRVVMLTNVFFGTNAGTTISTLANQTVVVTNGAGESFNLFFSWQDLDTAGQTLPEFAWAVIGPMTQNLGNTATPRNSGYSVTVTRFADIVTAAPSAVTATPTHTGEKSTVAWSATPYNYSYSVQAATDVNGPYAPLNTYQAVLMGVGEVPANISSALGFGTVAVSPDQTKITVNMNFSGLTTPASAGHIHGPAGAGTNASVVFPFSGVPAATSGAIPEQTFTITPTQLGYLQNGLLYMNVHNATYPGGEIRGQILLVPSRGLTFPTASGTFNDINASSSQKYYKVVSP